jgi:hypothetical protein
MPRWSYTNKVVLTKLGKFLRLQENDIHVLHPKEVRGASGHRKRNRAVEELECPECQEVKEWEAGLTRCAVLHNLHGGQPATIDHPLAHPVAAVLIIRAPGPQGKLSIMISVIGSEARGGDGGQC